MSRHDQLTLGEAARRLGVSKDIVLRWVADGLIQSAGVVRGQPVFQPDEIERARAALGFPTESGNRGS